MKFIPFIVLPVLLLISCKEQRNTGNEAEALDDFRANQEEFADKLEAAINSEGGMGLQEEDLARYQKGLEEVADKVGGKLGEAIRAVTALEKKSSKNLGRLNAFVEEFARVVDWSTLKEEKDFEKRRAFLEKYKAFNVEMITMQKRRPAEITDALDQINFEGQERQDFESSARKKLAAIIVPFEEIRQCDIDICDSSARVLDLLEAAGDNWAWNEGLQQVQLAKDSDLEVFNREMQLFDRLAQKQAEAQKVLLEVIKE